MTQRQYYHLTAPINSDSIARYGLNANTQGEIFLFKGIMLKAGPFSMWVSDSIALNQVGLTEYDVWKIHPKGMQGTLSPDNVGELPARYQHILHQPSVAPAFCKLYAKKAVDVQAVRAFHRAFANGIINLG